MRPECVALVLIVLRTLPILALLATMDAAGTVAAAKLSIMEAILPGNSGRVRFVVLVREF